MIQMTDNAAVEVKRVLEKAGKPTGFLRVGVKAGGCSGFSYTMDVVERAEEKDHVFGAGPVKLAVDPKSLLFLNGMILDYSDEMIGGGFQFKNPNAQKSCGCGTSFSV